jgi:integral membrane protein
MFETPIGRLRLLALIEGVTLLLLVFIAVPLKYIFDYPSYSKVIGPIHGMLFLLFVINTMSVAVSQQWKFGTITWKILLACVVPFGTFYIDRKILKPIQKDQK